MHLSQRRRLGVFAALFGVALSGAGVLTAPAQAQAGNNGTVKIDGVGDLDDGPGGGPGNENDPHISGCEAQIEWYGFDEGDDLTATVTFTVWPPTSQTAPSEDAVDGPHTFDFEADGTQGLNVVRVFPLSDLLRPFEPSQQGFHVQVVVETTSSVGASEIKHKVFWVDGVCTTDLCVNDPETAGDECCVVNCLQSPTPGTPVASVSESCGSGTVIVLDNRDVDEATTFVATVVANDQIVKSDEVVVGGGTFQELIYFLADGVYTVTVTVGGDSVLEGSGLVEVDCVLAEQIVNTPPAPPAPPPNEVLGVVQTAPALPRTGASSTLLLLATGLLLVVGGSALVLGVRLVPEARRA